MSRENGMIIKQVPPIDKHVAGLIEKLDAYQIKLYGIPSCNLESPESLVKNNAFMVGAYFEEELAGIGAMKIVSDYAEVKRMYVEEKYRGHNVAFEILQTLETFAGKNGVKSIFLETGNKQEAAIKFYRKHGFKEVESFGNYIPNDVSIYFAKQIQRNEMRLVKPERKYEASWMAALREFDDKGIGGFWHVPFKPVDIGEYVQRTENHSQGKNIPENWMPSTTFWLIDGNEFVGHVNVRHVLVEWSSKIGGHIGFAIKPSAWRKGYGRKILELALLEAKRIGLSEALVTCNESNIGSRKIIESNGGNLQDIIEVKGEMIRRYWIGRHWAT